MILPVYAAISAAVLLLVLFSRSHRVMNALTMLHPLAYLTLSAYSLSYLNLPAYFFADGYFFMDHLGLYEALITAVLFILAASYSNGYVERSVKMGDMASANIKAYYLTSNMLLLVITYAFFSNNLALLWVLAELTTIFSAVLFVTLNAKKNIGAALKYVFTTSTCMLFAFIGLIFLFTAVDNAFGAGTLNWNLLMEYAGALSPSILFASFVFIFAGFAAKSGVAPFHAWLPTAYSKAPVPAVIMSGGVTNLGVYGILRAYAIVAQTPVVSKVSVLLLAFGLLSIVVAVFTMLRQANLKKLIGYSTVEHTGLMLVGLGIGTPIAIFWVLFHILANSLTKALLFFSAGIIQHQFGSARMERIRNAFKLQALASWGVVFGSAAIIGIPPFPVFLSKFFILLQSATLSPILLLVLLLLLCIAIGSYGLFLTRIFSQVDESAHEAKYSPSLGMKLPIVALLFLLVALGLFFPQFLNELIKSAVLALGLG